MAVRCAKCGEELMGAVNRCWRCGQEFVSRADAGRQPPVRRPPIDSLELPSPDAPLQAELVGSTAIQQVAADTAHGKQFMRRGSPFAGEDQPALPNLHEAPVQPSYPTKPEAVGAAVGSLVLAVVGFLLLLHFPIGTLLVTPIGLLLGIFALRGSRRALAILALLLCCMAFATGVFLLLSGLYFAARGFYPWDIYLPL